MKKYDRETKQWVEEEVIDCKTKKRKLCRGGKEHDFILTLPPYVQTESSVLGIEVAQDYYRIEREKEELIEQKEEELARLGIKTRLYRGGGTIGRYYICSVCQKREYKNK